MAYGERRKVAPFDLSRRSSAELVALRDSANDWFAAEARRILAERRDASIVPELRRLLAGDRDETVSLRDLWALHVSGGLDDPTAMGLLDHPVPGVRRWTIRLLGDDHRMSEAFRRKLAELAATEPDAMVRSQLASSCQRWDADAALPILGRLARRDADRRDPHLPNLLWWAFERALRQDRDAVVDLLNTTEMQQSAPVREALLERVARALVSEGSDGDFAACARLLAAASEETTARLLAGMDEGLRGRKLARVPAPLAGPLSRLWESAKPAPGVVLIRLSARLGSPAAIAAAADLARDPRAAAADRAAMIEMLGQLRRPEDLPAIVGLLERDASPAVQLAAASALGGYGQASVASPLLERYRSASPAVRRGSWSCSARGASGPSPCWTRSSTGRSRRRT